MMKRLSAYLLIVCLASPVFAGKLFSKGGVTPMQTLFDAENVKFGGYGGPECSFTQVNGEDAVMVGGRGGLILNSTFSIGGAGYGLVTKHKVDNYKPDIAGFDDDVYLRAGYGGLFLEYINSSNSLVHFTMNTLLGIGGAVYTDEHFDDWDDDCDDDHDNFESSIMYVVEPGITVDLNVIKYFRIGVSASYRMVSGLDLPETSNSDLSGFSTSLIFKFGEF